MSSEEIRKKEFNNSYKKSDLLNSKIATNTLNGLGIGIISLNTKGQVIFLNKQAEQILEVTSSELTNKNISEFDFFDELYNVIIANREETYSIEYKNKTIVLNINNLKDNGHIIGKTIAFHKSYVKDKAIEEMNLASYLIKETNVVFEASVDGILITDKNGKILNVNKAFRNLYNNKPKSHYIGTPVEVIIKEENLDSSSVLIAMETKEVSNVMMKKDERTLIGSATPVLDEFGEIELVISVIRDVTEIEKMKLELIKQQEIANMCSLEMDRLRENRKIFPDVIMNSKTMQNVVDTVRIVAGFDSSILITGESGVGKEVVCKEIHRLSKRKDKPLIKINCSAIPAALFESEMFGYEEGAFTGAKKKGKKGYFEQANGGTLFLDEVGELSVDMQVKLLRAIQEHEIQRVGSEKTEKVDVRIIAATNKDLEKQVEEKNYREDLYYRLNVVNINIPPLRERTEDIVPLLNMFIRSLNIKYDKKRYFSSEIYSVLNNYSWPGNVRELENLVESLMVIARENEITVDLLPEKIYKYSNLKENINVNGLMTLKEATEAMEAKLFKNAIRECKSPKEIAEVLDINQSTVSRKLKAYNLK